MDKKLIEEFVKDRDEALLSLDKEKIIAYMNKYDVDVPQNELVFWAVVHKAIMQLGSASKEQKEKSSSWLLKNGFSPMM